MYKSFSMELAGRTLTVDVGRVAAQANGAAFMHYGDTTVLSTATASDKPRDGIDFFPLSVEFEEKMYSVGKIPGGFNKREGKASENAVLTARVIDRPMRPLFPKDYRNDVTLENLVLSVDQDCSPELTAMLGAAIATTISDIPFDGPISTTQVGLALRATGDNLAMGEANGIKVDRMKILGYMISNGLIALSGALLAQNNGYADMNMGTGTIVNGLAAIILAEVIVKYLPLGKRLWSIVVGAVLYRLVLVIILAMNVDAQMLKLASAILLAIILYVPEVRQKLKIRPNKSLTPGGDK